MDLWYGFHNSIKEGDGNRILRYWKSLLPIFQQEGHHNYSKEDLIVQSQVLLPRNVCELKRICTLNTQGMQYSMQSLHGTSELPLEINDVQFGIKHSAKSTDRMAKLLGVVHEICTHFKQESDISCDKGHHTYPSFKSDLINIS